MTAKNRELAGRERRKIFQMIADSMRLPKPLWRALAVALAGMFFLLVWDAVGALFIARHAPAMLGNELLLYITIKAGFVIVIAALITTSRSWRRLGYLGGAGSRFWTLMFPAWVSAALSLSGGIGDLSALRCAGWLGLGVVIAVGGGNDLPWRRFGRVHGPWATRRHHHVVTPVRGGSPCRDWKRDRYPHGPSPGRVCDGPGALFCLGTDRVGIDLALRDRPRTYGWGRTRFGQRCCQRASLRKR